MKYYKKHFIGSLSYILFATLLLLALVLLSVVGLEYLPDVRGAFRPVFISIPLVIFSLGIIVLDVLAIIMLRKKPRELKLNFISLILLIISLVFTLTLGLLAGFIGSGFQFLSYKIYYLIIAGTMAVVSIVYLIIKSVWLTKEKKILRQSDSHIKEFKEQFIKRQTKAKEKYHEEQSLKSFMKQYTFKPDGAEEKPDLSQEEPDELEETNEDLEGSINLDVTDDYITLEAEIEDEITSPESTALVESEGAVVIASDKEKKSKRSRTTSKEIVGKSYFDGFTLQYLGWTLLAFLVNVITLFTLYPVTLTWKLKWKYRHRVYEGRRLVFKGRGVGLLLRWNLWMFLSLITLGIFYLFVPVRIEKWKANNTFFRD